MGTALQGCPHTVYPHRFLCLITNHKIFLSSLVFLLYAFKHLHHKIRNWYFSVFTACQFFQVIYPFVLRAGPFLLSADELDVHIHPAADAGHGAAAGKLPVIHVVDQRGAQLFRLAALILRIPAQIFRQGAFFAGITMGLTYGKTMLEACGIGTRLAASVICTSENVCPRFLPSEFGLEIGDAAGDQLTLDL